MTGSVQGGAPITVVTGAHGGMGTACARVFGRRHRLVITDRDPGRLTTLREQLESDGTEVLAAIPGDLSAESVRAELVETVKSAGPLRALVHTAGLSPSLAGWDAILDVNLTTTVRLLDALEPLLAPGSAAVIIASMAGYSFEATPELEAAVGRLIDQGDRGPVAAIIQAASGGNAAGAAYAISKYGVLRLVEKRALRWARLGARLTSISPGLIATPMGRLEANQSKEAAALLQATPIGRWGAPLDIANAAEFLASDLAGFITGCDLLVDGGMIAAMRSGQRSQPEQAGEGIGKRA